MKTQEYLDVFARFKQKENIEAVERILSAHTELEPFERSQLGINASTSRVDCVLMSHRFLVLRNGRGGKNADP